MFLARPMFCPFFCGFPHAGGDVSLMPPPSARRTPFSPRRWGCFHWRGRCRPQVPVFPTQVGMFLRHSIGLHQPFGFPHAGGDVSERNRRVNRGFQFSPRRWGCFRRDEPQRDPPSVFPTQVGMFPRELTPSRVGPRFPHAGGDVSSDERRCAVVVPFSPRRWGCFFICFLLLRFRHVFPTQVGMFLKVK